MSGGWGRDGGMDGEGGGSLKWGESGREGAWERAWVGSSREGEGSKGIYDKKDLR